MKYVVDANLSPRLAVLLRDVGHDAVHVRDGEPRAGVRERGARRKRAVHDRVLVEAISL